MKHDPPPGSATLPVPAPSRRQILITLAGTVLVAAVILVVVVLPAEYQIDPTGMGRLLGLQRLDAEPGTEDIEMAAAGTATLFDKPYKIETVTLPLSPGEEIEFKAGVVEGATMIFNWQTDRGVLYSDFHAEPYNDLEQEPIRYQERIDVASGHGAVQAPFSGLHGWYWRNDTDEPIEVTLEVSGFFTHLKELYRAMADSSKERRPPPSGVDS